MPTGIFSSTTFSAGAISIRDRSQLQIALTNATFRRRRIGKRVPDGSATSRPAAGVADHTNDVRVVINRKRLVARAEIENATVPALPTTTPAKHFASLKPRDENQLVRRRDVET